LSLSGFWDEFERPTVRAEITILPLGVRLNVDLLVDTGSDFTAINPGDLRRVDMRSLGEPEILGGGYGGAVSGHRVVGLVALRSSEGIHIYQVALRLATVDSASSLPSVLGRDILKDWRMVHDPTNKVLDFEIWKADRFLPS
jgi:hypothetical protein